MLTGLQLTIGSFIMILLLCVIYFSKQRFLSIRNKLYRYMLIVVIFLLVSELIASYLAYIEFNELITLIVYKIHWSTGIVWFTLLYYYSTVFLTNIETKNLFELVKCRKSNKLLGIVFILGIIAFSMLPFSGLNDGYISYLPGYASYFVFLYCTIVVFGIIVFLLRNNANVPKIKKVSIWIMVFELAIIFSCQIIFRDIAFAPIGAVLQMFFLYFNIENPDLEIIKELEELKNNIEKSSKAKSDFLSNMSHEIRTPMNAIVGLSEGIIKDPNFDLENAKNDIKHISSAGNNLLDIINNILDISKIESGSESIEEKEYSVLNIINELSAIVETRLVDRPIKLILDIDKNLPSKLYGDSTKLYQVLLNLLTNAVKYTEVGKIKLSLNTEVKKDKLLMHFKISDTGFGIKKEEFDTLFEKFGRLESATQNEIEGTGLGLVITKKYVDLLGGKLWFESDYGVGTTFYIDVTQTIIDSRNVDLTKEELNNDSEIEYIDCSSKKVLIVDDNKLNIKVATKLLEPYKFEIESVNNGKDCIYKIKEDNKYDLIFLDHMMPNMDGIEVLHVLRKLEDYDLPPIIVLTANAITGMKQMYLDEGFDDYISKPINVVELNKIIKKHVVKKEQ